MSFEGSRAGNQELLLTNPGEPEPTVIRGDLFRRGRGANPSMDEDGTVRSEWVVLVAPAVAVQPLAEVQDPATGALFWVHGLPDLQRSLLTGAVDHREAQLRSVYRIPTVVDILRDSDVTNFNDLGDPVDDADATPSERTGVPASVVERSQIVPTDTDLRTVSTWVGWVPAGTDVQLHDRLRRQPDGALFTVDAITLPAELGLRELRLDLTRIT